MDEKRKVLIVEDNMDEIRIMKRAFRSRPSWEIREALDGAEALTALGVRPDEGDRWIPNLIVLNLCMPKIDGHEVLKKIKEDPELAPVPVVIWSVSISERDIELSYKLGAAAYFSKLVDSQDLLAQARTIRKFFDGAQLYRGSENNVQTQK